MEVILDIGNTDVVVAFYDEGSWKHTLRIPTHEAAIDKLFSKALNTFLQERNVGPSSIQYVAVSSVVPNVTGLITTQLQSLFEIEPYVIVPDSFEKLQIHLERPDQIGTDLVANAVAGFNMVKEQLMVIDFGTALTFTTIDSDGGVLGVAIAPGIKTAMKSLSLNAAQLSEIELIVPNSLLGKNTTHALQAGVMGGYTNMVKGMISSIKEEVGPLKTVATGGLSGYMSKYYPFDFVEPHLTLNGIRLIYLKNN